MKRQTPTTRRLRLLACSAALMAALSLPGGAQANEFAPMLEDLATSEIPAILSNEAIVAAVRSQNDRHAGLAPERIEALDQQWRAEVGSGQRPTIDPVLEGEAADHLRAAREASGGVFTEIFVMDAVGLNVAASDVTSDYWQGDEAKWQQTYAAGGLHIGEVEFDESTQTYQSQVSVAILDPDTAEPIGAATFGVNVEMIQ